MHVLSIIAIPVKSLAGIPYPQCEVKNDNLPTDKPKELTYVNLKIQ